VPTNVGRWRLVNKEAKRQLSIGFVSSLGFVAAYLLISISMLPSISENINRFIGGLPLFGATYYHVAYNKMLGRPILLLAILPYIFCLAGSLAYIALSVDRSVTTSANRVEAPRASSNSVYALVPMAIPITEVTFDYPLLREAVGGYYQYEGRWMIIYGIVSILFIQALSMDCTRRAGGR
jgi:uncharacterized membrane protein